MLTRIILNEERDITSIQSLMVGTAEALVFENFYHPNPADGAASFHHQASMPAYLNFLEKTLEELGSQEATPAEQEWLKKVREFTEHCKGYVKARTPEEIELFLDKFVELLQKVYEEKVEGHSLRFPVGETVAEIRGRYIEEREMYQD